MKRRCRWSVIWTLAGCFVMGQAEAQTVLPNPRLLNSELLARGRVVYQNHCAGCHGEKGDGLGPGAYGLNPKPRDFTTGLFKFRSTPQGTLPTDEDLFRSIRQGIPGTSMPAFHLMAERDVLAVAQFLKTFSEEWRRPENYGAPIPVPPPPDWFNDPGERSERISKGREFFTAACAACHGDKGDGRGLAADSLVDFWSQPVRPADLRRPFIRSGRNLSDIYKALATGINGSPMPSFLEATDEDQRWELVAFIAHLRGERADAGGMIETAADTAVSEGFSLPISSSNPYE